MAGRKHWRQPISPFAASSGIAKRWQATFGGLPVFGSVTPSREFASGRPRRTRVVLFGPYVSRNLGDTATQLTVIQELLKRRPDLEILGASPEPDDTLRSLGIPAFPLSGQGRVAGDLGPFLDPSPESARSDLRRPYSPTAIYRIAQFVRSIDVLVISGGGQLDDTWGGAWGHPWLMFVWTALARLFGVPVVFLCVGLDRLKSVLSQRFAVWALKMATEAIFRDVKSQLALKSMGMTRSSSVHPDLVFSLSTEKLIKRQTSSSANRFVVISPISWRTWSSELPPQHHRYMEALCELGLEFSRSGHRIRVVCSQSAMDMEDAQLLVQHLATSGVEDVSIIDAPQVADFLGAVNGAELVVASRLHAVILSLIADAPVLAISHLAKVDAVMEQIGMPEFCFRLQEFDRKILLELARLALTRSQSLRDEVVRRRKELGSDVGSALDRLARMR